MGIIRSLFLEELREADAGGGSFLGGFVKVTFSDSFSLLGLEVESLVGRARSM